VHVCVRACVRAWCVCVHACGVCACVRVCECGCVRVWVRGVASVWGCRGVHARDLAHTCQLSAIRPMCCPTKHEVGACRRRAQRDTIYFTLLRRMSPEHKFATQAKLVGVRPQCVRGLVTHAALIHVRHLDIIGCGACSMEAACAPLAVRAASACLAYHGRMHAT